MCGVGEGGCRGCIQCLKLTRPLSRPKLLLMATKSCQQMLHSPLRRGHGGSCCALIHMRLLLILGAVKALLAPGCDSIVVPLCQSLAGVVGRVAVTLLPHHRHIDTSGARGGARKHGQYGGNMQPLWVALVSSPEGVQERKLTTKPVELQARADGGGCTGRGRSLGF